MAEYTVRDAPADSGVNRASALPGACLRARGVRLRTVEEHDLPILYSWAQDPSEFHLWRGAAGLPARNRFCDELRQRLTHDLQHMVAERTADRSLIGWMSAYAYSAGAQSCEMTGYVPPGNARRSGEGLVAGLLFVDYLFFGLALPVRRVTAVVYAYNLRSQQMLAKLGFVREGVLREAHYFGGQYHDVLYFGLMRRDWEGMRLRLRMDRLTGRAAHGAGPSAGPRTER